MSPRGGRRRRARADRRSGAPAHPGLLGRETLIPKTESDMAFWREKLFITMVRNARNAADYFSLPSNRVVELGAQVVL